MTYRDDRDADQARIAALQHELAAAYGRIAELEGRPAKVVEKLVERDVGLARPITRKATEVLTDRERIRTYAFDRAMTVARAGDLLGMVSERTHRHGRVERHGTGARWISSECELDLVIGRGTTKLVASQERKRSRLVIVSALGVAACAAAALVSPLALLGVAVGGVAIATMTLGPRLPDDNATALWDRVAELVERELA